MKEISIAKIAFSEVHPMSRAILNFRGYTSKSSSAIWEIAKLQGVPAAVHTRDLSVYECGVIACQKQRRLGNVDPLTHGGIEAENALDAAIAQAIEEMKAEQGDSFSLDHINLAELERRCGISRGKLRRLKRNGFQDLPSVTKSSRHKVIKLSG